MKISKRQLKRIIREEKRLLTESMTEWEDYPDITDYVWADVRTTLVSMIDEQVMGLSVSPDVIDDIVTNTLLGAMADIANQLGVEGPGAWTKDGGR
jgi:hypothetical protein